MYCALDVENLGMTVLQGCVNMDSGNDKEKNLHFICTEVRMLVNVL